MRPPPSTSGTGRASCDTPYPGGESWQQAVDRVGRFLHDLPLRWQDRRVLVIGHVATRWALDHHIGGVPLETLAARDFAWQPGWEYALDLPARADSRSVAGVVGEPVLVPVDLRGPVGAPTVGVRPSSWINLW